MTDLQQINLYAQEFRPVREPLMAVQLLAIVVCLVFLMGVMSAWSWQQGRSLKHTVASLETETAETELRLSALRAKQRKSIGPQIDREIEKLQHQVKKRLQIKALIQNQNLGNAQGFSAQLTAMAQRSTDDLSVYSFGFTDGGSYISMAGWVKTADAVPRYLQLLRKDASFSKARVGVLTVEKPDDRRDALHFTIAPAEVELEPIVNVIPTPVAMLQSLNQEAADETVDTAVAE